MVDGAQLAWERRGSPFYKFSAVFVGAAVVALVLGAGLDTLIVKAQDSSKDGDLPTRKNCGTWFLAHVMLLAAIMWTAHSTMPRFLPWLQISLSGFMFNVLLFVSQKRLESNARCVVSF